MIMDIQLLIKASKIYQPILEGEILLETERVGSPSKLTFTVIKDDIISFPEGARVQLKVNGTGVFSGFIFQKSRDKEHHIKCVAYDQLRYFKNKETYAYTNKTATELIRMVAKDFNLIVGTLDNTGFKIPKRIEDNQTLFDIVLNALDITTASTRQLFVLYDDFGKITLKNANAMQLKLLIDKETAENFSYTSSIDGDTFNQIKLVRENKTTGKRDVYIARDNNNIGNWGVLQYYETIPEKVNGQRMADAMLSLKNRKTRSLSISGCLGDLSVRAGCSFPVDLNLGDIETRTLKKRLVCERVTHRFTGDYHSMDITLFDGGTFL